MARPARHAQLALTVLLLAVSKSASADAFGRFGYSKEVHANGFVVDSDGFGANYATSDRLRFDAPSRLWSAVTVSDMSETVLLGTRDLCPSKLRFDLTSGGFSSFFPHGLKLRVASTGAPYLTWKEGSVSTGVPTPDKQWLAISFRDAQPPIVLGFPGSRAGLIVRGKPGNWTIESAPSFKGWVRIGLPEGLAPRATNTASALGVLALKLDRQASIWTSMPPQLLKVAVSQNSEGVTATWTFDKEGAIVPVAATLAPMGGYPLRVLSPTLDRGLETDDGPCKVLEGTQLRIHFPVRRVPTGRAVVEGSGSDSEIATASPDDPASVAELALANLVSTRESSTRATAESTLTEYLAHTNYTREPVTGQQFPFDAEGHGTDLAAAQALLMQCLTCTEKATSEANSLLTSITWRRDWLTWRVACNDVKTSRRAGSLAALAGALCPEPERRLDGAMLQAGLSAQRGLQLWLRHRAREAPADALIEPLLGVRQSLFALKGNPAEGYDFGLSLFSPIRVYGTTQVALAKASSGLSLQWPALEPKPSYFTFASAYPLAIKPLSNLASLKLEQSLGFTLVHYIPDTAGTCIANLQLPLWAKPPPQGAVSPRYAE